MTKQLSPLLLVLTLASVGCVAIGQRPAVNQDRELRRHTEVEVPAEGGSADIKLEGMQLTVTASRACDIRQDRVVDRTATAENYNRAPAITWALAGAGVASVAGGVVLLVDAGSTYPNDTAARTYNETGPGKERLYGYALIGTGALLGTIAIVDAIRASGETVKRGEATVPGKVVKQGVRCTNQPLVDAGVTGRVLDEAFPLGRTNMKGLLDVDLDTVVPDSVVSRGGSKLAVDVAGEPVGTVDIGRYVADRETRAFRQADLDSCRTPKATGSCDSVRRFLQTFPAGAHAKEAKQVLDGAKAKLTQLEDDDRWSHLDLAACSDKKFDTPEEVVGACVPLWRYLEDFPQGRHADDVRKAFNAGEARGQRLASEQRKEQEAAEKKAAEAERRQCVAQCKIGCSGWSIRDQASCFSGCVESRCSGE